MTVRLAGLLVVAPLALGCRGRPGGSDAGVAARDDAGAIASPADAGACARKPEEIRGPYVDLCLSPAEVEAFAATLRDAVARHDPARVASLARYPLRVHTASCVKHLAAPGDLVAHYDEVLTPELQARILSTHPPFFVRQESIMLADGGRLWAWAQGDGRLLLGGVFLGTGDLAGVACADRVAEPIPETVWGTWAVSSVRSGELEELTSFPWPRWRELTVSLDRATRTLTAKLGGREKTCSIVGLTRDTSPAPDVTNEVPRCSALETFYGPHAGERVLQGTCPGGDLVAAGPRADASVSPELVVLDGDTMALRLACEGIAILKKRSARDLAAARRRVPVGAPCGTPDVDCAPGTRCVATSAHPLTERCKALAERAE